MGFRPTKNLENKNCENCGVEFTPYRKTQKLCSSKECKKAYNRQYSAEFRKTNEYKQEFKNVMAKWRAENPAKKILSNIKTRNNIDLDEEWIQERLDNGICEVTGIPFEFPEYGSNKRGFNHHPWTASVDKIDPSKGYRKDNCQLVVWAYNRAKGLWDEDVMIKLAKGMYDGLVK